MAYQIYLKVLSKENVEHIGLIPRTLQFGVQIWEPHQILTDVTEI